MRRWSGWSAQAATHFPVLVDGEQPVRRADLVDLFGERLDFGGDSQSYREPGP